MDKYLRDNPVRPDDPAALEIARRAVDAQASEASSTLAAGRGMTTDARSRVPQ